MGTLTHLWWECPKIQKYWGEVVEEIQQITGEQVNNNPWACMFHDTEREIPQYIKSVTPLLLNAAKALIPCHWKDIEIPRMKDWITKVEWIRGMEEVRHLTEGRRDKYLKRWAGWHEYRNTERYVTIMDS